MLFFTIEFNLVSLKLFKEQQQKFGCLDIATRMGTLHKRLVAKFLLDVPSYCRYIKR